MKQYIKQTKRAFGELNKCLGKEFSLEISERDLENFLNDLEPARRDLFNKSVVFYILYMENINFLNNKEKRKKDAIDYFSYTVWSNVSISIIFSIIDEITIKEKGKFQYFSDFLKENFIKIKVKEDIDTLRNEHDNSGLNPSTMKRLSKFYNENLEEGEKRTMID